MDGGDEQDWDQCSRSHMDGSVCLGRLHPLLHMPTCVCCPVNRGDGAVGLGDACAGRHQGPPLLRKYLPSQDLSVCVIHHVMREEGMSRDEECWGFAKVTCVRGASELEVSEAVPEA
jgi:hypothetical protein